MPFSALQLLCMLCNLSAVMCVCVRACVHTIFVNELLYGLTDFLSPLLLSPPLPSHCPPPVQLKRLVNMFEKASPSDGADANKSRLSKSHTDSNIFGSTVPPPTARSIRARTSSVEKETPSQSTGRVQSPTERVQSPAERVQSPTERVQSPAERVKSPTEPAKPPIADVKPTEERAKPRVKSAKPSVETSKPPVQSAKPSVESAKPRVGSAKPQVKRGEGHKVLSTSNGRSHSEFVNPLGIHWE